MTFLFFLFILVIIGMYQSRKVRDEEDYLFAGRKSGVLSLTSTLVMTELNASTLISFASMGYIFGGRALLFPFIFLIGLAFYALVVAKRWKKLNANSCCELFRRRYSPALAKCASLCLLIAMTGFNATYVKSLDLIFSPLFPSIQPWLISALLVSTTLLMTIRGGLRAVIRTDVFTFFATGIALITLFFATRKGAPLTKVFDSEVFHSSSTPLPLNFIVSLIVLTMFTYILAPWYAQKIFSAKSTKVAFISTLLAAALVFLFYGLVVLSTGFIRLHISESIAPETALPYIISHVAPFGFKGLTYAVLFAASATTLSGAWSAMSAMITSDFFPKGDHDHKRSIGIICCLAFISFVLGNTLIDQVFNKLILSNIPIAALSFALLAGFYWKRASTFGAYLSIVVGISWAIFCYFYFGEQGMYTWYWVIFGIPLTFFSGIVGSLLRPSLAVRFGD